MKVTCWTLLVLRPGRPNNSRSMLPGITSLYFYIFVFDYAHGTFLP
jgi:hypothetical protein